MYFYARPPRLAEARVGHKNNTSQEVQSIESPKGADGSPRRGYYYGSCPSEPNPRFCLLFSHGSAACGPRDRSIVTIIALAAGGTVDSSLLFHMKKGKENGLTREEAAEALTHAAFYIGWPKAWAAFNLAKEVWTE